MTRHNRTNRKTQGMKPAEINAYGQRLHNLKTVQPFFNEVLAKAKTFEIRKHDRDFRVGDLLILNKYDANKQDHRFEFCVREITYILQHRDFPEGIQPGFCVLGMKEAKP